MFYTIRFIAALAALGVNPKLVESRFRQYGKTECKNAGLSPQEAAIVVMGGLQRDIQALANPLIAGYWVDGGKVRADHPAIRLALENLGWRIGLISN